MNRNIPKLLRLRYAANMIAFEKAHSKKDSKNSEQRCEEYLREIQLPLTETTPEGKIKAINGRYVARIFSDIFEKTGSEISELNTRKRIMGVHSNLSTYNPSEDSKLAIIRYLGCKSWEQLEKDAQNLISVYEQKLYGGLFLRTSKIGPQKFAKGMFFPSDYNEKQIIEMNLEDGCSLRLLCQGNCKFMVTKVQGLSLEPKDILVITSVLQRGGDLYAEEISRGGKLLGSYMGSHPIIDFNTVIDKSSMDEILSKASELIKELKIKL